ncbi:MAG: hypothetical protein R3B06_16215 [Kofleriaceae bacterium]
MRCTHRLALVALVVTTVTCGRTRPPRYVSANYTAAALDGQTLRVVDQLQHYPDLEITAAWVAEAPPAPGPDGVAPTTYCVVDQPLTVATPAGSVALTHATACATTRPFSMVGEANVAFPALGFLRGIGVSGDAPRAKVALGLGAHVGTLELAGEPLDVNPHTFYLMVDFYAGLRVGLGQVELSTPEAGARMVVAPQVPMIYIGGELAGVIEDGGLAFGADGRIPFTPQHALFDGAQWRSQTYHGHILAQGTVPLGKYPLAVGGRVLVNVDPDGDGRTVFTGDDELVLVGDGHLSFDLPYRGLSFKAPLGAVSFRYDVGGGLVSFSGRDGGGAFKGTPLAFLSDRSSSRVGVRGMFRSLDDFEVAVEVGVPLVAGFGMLDGVATLTGQGINLAGAIKFPHLGQVAVTGAVAVDGQFALTGTGELRPFGFRLAQAAVTVSNAGARVAGELQLPGLGSARLDGSVLPSGEVTLHGTADLTVAGVRMAGAAVDVDGAGVHVAGTLQLPLFGQAALRGDLQADGGFALRGTVAVVAAGFPIAGAAVTVSNLGVHLDGRLVLPGLGQIAVAGDVRPDARFTLTGTGDLRVAGFALAGAAVTLTERGAALRGRLDLATVGAVEVSGDGRPDGQFQLRGRADLSPGGFKIARADVVAGSGGVELAGTLALPNLGSIAVRGVVRPGGVSLSGRGDLRPAGLPLAGAKVEVSLGRADISGRLSFLGSSFDVRGAATPTGAFDLGGAITVNLLLVRGTVAVTVGASGASAKFSGEACVPIPLKQVCTTLGGFGVNSRGEICPSFPVVGEQCIKVLGT